MPSCVGVRDVFFPPEGFEAPSQMHARIRRAQGICVRCDGQVECRMYAIENRERDGVWGGVDFSDGAKKRATRARLKAIELRLAEPHSA